MGLAGPSSTDSISGPKKRSEPAGTKRGMASSEAEAAIVCPPVAFPGPEIHPVAARGEVDHPLQGARDRDRRDHRGGAQHELIRDAPAFPVPTKIHGERAQKRGLPCVYLGGE